MSRALLVLALLAGCASGGPPAPISYGGAGADRAAPPPARTPTPPPAPVRRVVEPAPAPDWADGEGRPLSDYALRPDEAQPFDPAALPRTHRVGENETLYDIASRYQVPLRALIDQNRLEPPYALTPGRELALPPPRVHTVARGERFEEIAQRYNVDLRSLALLNRMRAPYDVRPGDRIVLPAMARAAEPAPAPVDPRRPATPAPAAAGARFTAPLQGDIVARFGVQPGGVRIDGIEIAGREGDAIMAAADGDVVYAGADLPAYGVLVLVRHADDYVTAYGYTRRALVREGQRVRAGERIAELGPRPDGRARLLFQVRRGREAVDPAPLLGVRE